MRTSFIRPEMKVWLDEKRVSPPNRHFLYLLIGERFASLCEFRSYITDPLKLTVSADDREKRLLANDTNDCHPKKEKSIAISRLIPLSLSANKLYRMYVHSTLKPGYRTNSKVKQYRGQSVPT